MRKWIAPLLILTLLVQCLGAGALSIDDSRFCAQGDDYAVYIGPNNHLYHAGDDAPILEEPVRAIVHVDEMAIFYTTADENAADHDGQSLLMVLDTQAKGDPELVSGILGNAIWSPDDGMMYFVKAESPAKLSTFYPADGAVVELADAGDRIVSLRSCAAGLLVATESAEQLYNPALQALTDAPYETAGIDFTVFGRNEALLDSAGNLSLRLSGLRDTVSVDSDVHSLSVQDGVVYYFRSENGKSTLKSYDISTGEGKTLYAFSEFMIGDLTTDSQAAYFVGETTAIMRYLFAEGKPEMLTALGRENVASPYLQSFYGLLLIYDMTADSDQSFEEAIDIEAEAKALSESAVAPDTAANDDEIAPAPQHEDENVPFEEVDTSKEDAAEPAPTPAPAPKEEARAETAADFKSLSRGARGEDVARLQQTLKRLGYLSGSADGVYGAGTERAVLLLQEDMGYSQTGSAGPKFQYAVFHGDPPYYSRYVSLQKGDSGSRVTELQERLRALYYMKTNAGGHYKSETAAAIKRFQKQMGYKANGKISASQMKKLFSDSAHRYKGYLDLERGDQAPVVKRLCERLKKLGYYSGKVTSSYSKKLKDAVLEFQAYNGLYADGVASAELQRNMIFDPNARHYKPDPGPEPDPTPEPESYASKKQLKTITSWMKKHFNKDFSQKQAIAKLQKTLNEMGYRSGSITKIYDQNTYNGVARFQEAVGIGPTGIADKATLKALY